MKNYVRLQRYQGAKGHFQIKLPQILMVLVMSQLVQGHVQVVEYTFIDDSK